VTLYKTDVAIVGTGPGGASVARALARAGRRVLLLERGRDWRSHPLYGTYPGVLLYADKQALLFTREGLNIVRPLMVGGATSMYCGCSAPVLPWWRKRYHIELESYAEQLIAELHIRPLPPELRGAASTRVAQAAGELGMEWLPQDKFMLPERAHPFDCGAKCMLGCRCRAKWNAAEFVDQAVAAGAQLWTHARVEHVMHADGYVTGLTGRQRGKPFQIDANTVIVAAGGIGSPILLRNSGFEAAGRGMTMDTTAMVYGLARSEGMGHDPPMTWSYADDELGVLYSTLVDPWLMYPIILMRKSPAYPLTWHRWGRTFGVMIKLKDEISGEVDTRGRISKGLTAADHGRLSQAERVATRILERAGCDPKTIFTTPLRGTHPSSTVRIGEMLSKDLETEVQGLYVCDASVFPEALARPTVLTILALGQRLADHLQNKGEASG
jgi:choline dehydrogenase-like flavoprotein